MSIEPEWWSKSLKKNLEAIYKHGFKVMSCELNVVLISKEPEEINDDIIEKAFTCIKAVVTSCCDAKSPVSAFSLASVAIRLFYLFNFYLSGFSC